MISWNFETSACACLSMPSKIRCSRCGYTRSASAVNNLLSTTCTWTRQTSYFHSHTENFWKSSGYISRLIVIVIRFTHLLKIMINCIFFLCQVTTNFWKYNNLLLLSWKKEGISGILQGISHVSRPPSEVMLTEQVIHPLLPLSILPSTRTQILTENLYCINILWGILW